MEECSYCGATVDDQDELLAHFEAEHSGELGRIDRRRVDSRVADADGLPVTMTAVVVAVMVVGIGGVLAVVILLGGTDPGPSPGVDDVEVTPTNFESVHFHGLMEVEIDGDQLDFATDDRFIMADSFFHFHGGNHVWHVHGEAVTLEYALGTLGIRVSDGGSVVEFEGERYDDADADTTVSITVNGQAVEPETYVLQGVPGASPAAAADGDHVRVLVEREG